jgi:hypothetical protein
MAKPNPPGPVRSKVKILFVDADLAPGDLEKLTNTLTSAMRPTHLLQKAPPRLSAVSANGDGDDPAVADAGEVVESEAEDEAPAETHQPKPARPRKYKSPKVIDLDMKAGGKAFVDFANEKAPESHTDRYLVAAYWLEAYAKIVPVTADHVFTCYKSAGWVFDPSDPNFPFRELSGKRRREGETKDGNFTINHIGRANVEKMGPAA